MNQLPTTFAIGGVAHPVELLRDSKGIYGIGTVAGEEFEEPNVKILLRPDRLDEATTPGPIYQMITGGFRHGMFSNTAEERLRRPIHHAMLRRPTAVKLLRAENAQDVRAQSRFQQEVQLTCQLTHPNTIEIFDYGRTPEGIFYYAMEYLDGFTLEALVSLAGPVEPRRVVMQRVEAPQPIEAVVGAVLPVVHEAADPDRDRQLHTER